MGMNYYVVSSQPTIQPPIHIGKSSAGWLFGFQAQNDIWHDPPVVWNTFEQVRDWLKKHTVDDPKNVIINEEDEVISYSDFIKIVECKQNDEHCISNPDNFKRSRNVNGYRFMDGEFS